VETRVVSSATRSTTLRSRPGATTNLRRRSVPDDFDQMGGGEVEKLFNSDL
jgi:hypothetical protein